MNVRGLSCWYEEKKKIKHSKIEILEDIMFRPIEEHMFLGKQAIECITLVNLLIPEDVFIL